MANPFQQQSRLRKLIYFGLILALFTTSLFHRKFIVEPEATALQLREQAQGEVELTSSAVRLTLIGSRGLATCLLWQTALEKQKKHQWNEMDLLVNSITKLQPHFVTPWLFQSWNLAFNVAVECDRTRDKYFYVTRGLQLLAEGERRNQGSLEEVSDPSGKRIRFPGNPDMRFHMGFTYQLKIGNSDEKYVMRCLLDLSCIDPLKRDPEKLWKADRRGQRVVDLEKFAKFCEQNPRLVRRLREQCGLDSPKRVVDFLRDNKEVPSRFEPPAGAAVAQEQSELKMPARLQFPILPPRGLMSDIPDAAEREFPQVFDVYRASQAWYIYAQEPLPPAYTELGLREPDFDRVLHRLPKMAMIIFRGYPSRAQAFIAENLGEEGWFDDSGWQIKDWFDDFRPGGKRATVVVGREPKYHAREAWQQAYEWYYDYGNKNGLYIAPERLEELEARAALFRRTFPSHPITADLRREQRLLKGGKMGDSFDAHRKLYWNTHYRRMTNYDTYIHMTDVERRPETVQAHKDLFYALRLKDREADLLGARRHYEKGFPRWLDVLLSNPGYRVIQDVQIETYEAQLKYLRLMQDLQASELQDVISFLTEFGMVRLVPAGVVNLPAGLARWEVTQELPAVNVVTQFGLVSPLLSPLPTVSSGLELTSAPVPHRQVEARNLDLDQVKIIPIRNVRGPFERIFVCDIPQREKLQDVLLALTQGSQPVPLALSPWQKARMLTVTADRDLTRPPAPWVPLIGDDVINSTRDRLGLNRERQPRPTGRPRR